jgi:hypothetical protein
VLPVRILASFHGFRTSGLIIVFEGLFQIPKYGPGPALLSRHSSLSSPQRASHNKALRAARQINASRAYAISFRPTYFLSEYYNFFTTSINDINSVNINIIAL